MMARPVPSPTCRMRRREWAASCPHSRSPSASLVEGDARRLDQDFLQQGGTFLRQDARRLGQGGARARLQDVLHQQVGAVIRSAADDPALGIARCWIRAGRARG